MKLTGKLYCEGPDCERWWEAGLTRFHNRTLISFPPDWLLVSNSDETGTTERTFCGYDCLMKWCAQFDPPEVIGVDDA